MKYGIIYKHTNKINGKVYVGQTIQIDNLERRWRRKDKTYSSYRSCPTFFNALNKYGWDNFETRILEECDSQDLLNRREEYFMNLYNSLVPTGYNTNAIADGGVKHCEETREKMSKKRIEYFANLTERPKAINKKEHIFIDGIEHKHCYKCDENKLLADFCKDKNRWDGLATGCKTCHYKLNKDHKTEQKLSPEEFKASYEDRQKAVSEGVRKSFEDNPELRAKQAKRKSKPIVGTNVETGVEIEFASAKEAGNYGFVNTRIGECIKKVTVHKNHTWRFK